MEDRTQNSGTDQKREFIQPDPIQDSTLLPMLIVGLALIVDQHVFCHVARMIQRPACVLRATTPLVR